MLDVKHLVGLDLGQVSDYTALVSLRREQQLPDPTTPKAYRNDEDWRNVLTQPAGVRPTEPAKYYCNIAERFERGIPYTTLVENVTKLFQGEKFAGQTLVVDGTGVGRPVVDLFRKAKVDCSRCGGQGRYELRPGEVIPCTFCKQGGKVPINCRLVPVTITGGGVSSSIGKVDIDTWGYWHVPKKELVGSVQVLLGTGRLEVSPGLKQAATLVHELKSFSYKISANTAHVALESWRDRDHDDLVLALALAAWYGERARQELWVR